MALELNNTGIVRENMYYYCYFYIRLMAFFPGQPGLASTRKVHHSGLYWSKR